MDNLIPYILTNFGIPGGIAVILYYVIERATKQRKEERDVQMDSLNRRMDALENSLTKHINRHEAYEKSVCGKIDKIYERLNPISDSVNFIKGVLEGKNDKG